jgi:hypothetical protein
MLGLLATATEPARPGRRDEHQRGLRHEVEALPPGLLDAPALGSWIAVAEAWVWCSQGSTEQRDAGLAGDDA